MKKQYTLSITMDSLTDRFFRMVGHKRAAVVEAIVEQHLSEHGGYLSQEAAAAAKYQFKEKDKLLAVQTGFQMVSEKSTPAKKKAGVLRGSAVKQKSDQTSVSRGAPPQQKKDKDSALHGTPTKRKDSQTALSQERLTGLYSNQTIVSQDDPRRKANNHANSQTAKIQRIDQDNATAMGRNITQPMDTTISKPMDTVTKSGDFPEVKNKELVMSGLSAFLGG